MSLQDIVNVSIVRGTKTVTQAGFGTLMIMGTVPAGWGTDKTRIYQSTTAAAADFLPSDPIYKAISAAFAQELKPVQVKVGRRSALTTQVSTLTPNVATQAIQNYIVTINNVAYNFVSDSTPTAAEVVAGLTALINADLVLPVTASGTTTLILTSDAPGQGFSVDGGLLLTVAATTPNNGVVEDMIALQALDDDWYALMLTSRTDADILAAAAWVETQRKMFLACSASAAVPTSVTTDVASILKNKAYARTAYLFSNDQADFPEAAWLGGVLPMDPGSETWKFKSLVGINPDDALTATQISYIKGKNANMYETIAGAAITAEGVVAVGEFIDVIRFVDWLQAQIQENIYLLLVSVKKVPFTDGGVAQIESILRAQLNRGVRVGGLAADPAPDVTAPLVVDVPILDRKNRHLPDVEFTATLAGAIHSLTISGVVSV